MSDSDSFSQFSSDERKNIREETIIRVRGPNYNATFNPPLHPFRNSTVITSQQRLRDPFSETSMLRGEPSAMAMRSVYHPLPHNSLQQSYRFAQSSMISARNEREKSPAESMCSIASNISKATDIITALKDWKFNQSEFREIRDAYNKYVKGKSRKKMSKRRNIRSFMRGVRRRLSGDSGERASDSSLSSDDCRSNRTGITMGYDNRRNLSSLQKYSHRGRTSDDAQSTRTVLTTHSTGSPFSTKAKQQTIIDLIRTGQNNTMYQDSTENFKQSQINNLLRDHPSKNTYTSTSSQSKMQNNTQNAYQRERFKNSILLPSQRFNKSTAVQVALSEELGENIAPTKSIVMNNKSTNLSNLNKNFININQNYNCSGSDNENIFSEVTNPERSFPKYPESQRKRSLDSSDESPDEFKSRSKKLKVSSPKNVATTTSLRRGISKPSKMQNNTQNAYQRERFKNSILLPSQRFNKSTAVQVALSEELGENIAPTKSIVMNNKSTNLSNLNKNFININQNYNCSGSDNENIFSEVTNPERSFPKYPETQRKSSLDSSDESPDEFKSRSKKLKVSSPKKVATTTSLRRGISKPNNEQAKRQNDFVFAKPTLPRKSANAKNVPIAVNTQAASKPAEQNKSLPETISQSIDQNLSKEQTMVSDHSEIVQSCTSDVSMRPRAASKPAEQNKSLPETISQSIDQNLSKEQTMVSDHSEIVQSCTSDVSMRPSFIKRKLYTQTLDVTEKMNNSMENSPNASPQTKFNGSSKEKNKTRKVVTNQSCLSRDIHTEDKNLLDLIHKVVPPDRMNVTTNSTQKIDMCPTVNVANASHKRPAVQEERWDVTSIISTYNNDQDISDTFTDEEIFIVRDKNTSKKDKTEKRSVEKSTVVRNAKPAQERGKEDKLKTPNKEIRSQNNKEQTIKSCADRFWQTDSETDDLDTPKQQPSAKINKIDEAAPKDFQEQAEINKSRVANRMLEIAGPSNAPLEDIGKSVKKVASNKSLRIRAARALKKKKTDYPEPLKTPELQIKMIDILAKDNVLRKRQIKPSKNLVNRNKNSNTNEVNGNTYNVTNNTKENNENITAPKESNTVKNGDNNRDRQPNMNVKKGSHNGNALMNTEPVRKAKSNTEKELNNNSKKIPAAANATETQNKQITKLTTTAPTNTDIAKPNLNVSKRGRVRKLTKPFVSPAFTTQRKSIPNTIRNTPNVATNKVIRKRVLETQKKNTTEQILNVSKRGRPRKASNNTTLYQSVNERAKKNQQKVPPKSSVSPITNNTQTKVDTPKKQVLHKGTKNKPPKRKIKDKSFTCCEDSRESIDVPKIIKPQTNNVPCTRNDSNNDKFARPIAQATLATVPDSPEFCSAMQKAGARTNPVAVPIKNNNISGAFGLGFATATIGLRPRHCATQETSKITIPNDNKKVRSVSSMSSQSRSRRPKYLHVF